MACAQPDVSVRDRLQAAARELTQIAELGCRLQDHLSPLLMRAGDAAFEAQALDNLVQHAQGLGAFLDALGRDCPESWRLALTAPPAGLGLTAQRDRLTLQTGRKRSASPAPPSPHGELELF